MQQQVKIHQRAIQIGPFVAKNLHSRAEAIFDGQGAQYIIRSMANGAVRGVDIGNYRFITQNPNKPSEWGQAAAQGKQITWLIHRPSNKWVARIVEGIVYEL